jgi:hypothetical protein
MYFPAVTDVCLITAQDMHIDIFDRITRDEFLIQYLFKPSKHNTLYLYLSVRKAKLSKQTNKLTNRPRLETHPPRHLDGKRRLRLQFERAPDDGHNGARNMLSSVYATKQ